MSVYILPPHQNRMPSGSVLVAIIPAFMEILSWTPYCQILHSCDRASWQILIIKKLDALISQIYFGMKLYMFRTVPLSIITKAVYKPVWHITLLSVQSITPDDGQRNCPKHVEFHFKNKFEKLVHLVGFIVRIILSLYFLQTFPQGIFRNFTTSIFIHNFGTVKYVVSAMLAATCLSLPWYCC
jgi:hypothetical protein